MVGYRYMFLILQYFEDYPNLNEVVSINPNLIWAVAIYPNVYNICKSEWTSFTLPRSNFQYYPSLSETVSITQIRFEAIGICSNVSDDNQIPLKLLHITQSEWSFLKLP